MLPKTKVSKDLGLATDLTNTSGRSASRAMPKARLTYCLQLDCMSASVGRRQKHSYENMATKAKLGRRCVRTYVSTPSALPLTSLTLPIQSSWATKVSEIGQQALVGAKGAEESQGRKDHGIPNDYRKAGPLRSAK